MASSTGSTRSVSVGVALGARGESLETRTASASATSASWATTDQRRGGLRAAYAGELGGEGVAHHQPDRDDTRPRPRRRARARRPPSSPTARAGAARATSQAASARSPGRGRGPTPSGAETASTTSGSARPSTQSRRDETPRSEARASSGTRISLAAISSRISRARATRTRDSTAGAIEARAVACCSRTSSRTAPRLLTSGTPTSVPPGDLGAGVQAGGGLHGRVEVGTGEVGGDVERGVDAHRPLPGPERGHGVVTS